MARCCNILSFCAAAASLSRAQRTNLENSALVLLQQSLKLHEVPTKAMDIVSESAEYLWKYEQNQSTGVSISSKESDVVSTRIGNPVPLCFEAGTKSSVRHLLIGVTAPYHGSSAFQGAMMSSKKLSHLCSLGTWQCEGFWKMFEYSADNDKRNNVSNWDISEMLSTYAGGWNLSNPVLFDKSPVPMMQVEAFHKKFKAVSLPSALTSIGIQELKLGYVLMWRPICLSNLSSYSIKNIEKYGHKVWAEKEMGVLQDHVNQLNYMDSQGLSVLVVNFANLIWKPWATRDRLQNFLPCLGELNMNHVPTLGDQLYPGNLFKAKVSVSEYGQSVDPSKYYDNQKGKCKDAYPGLDDKETARLDSLTQVLTSRS